jgi:hypothetical protein
MKILPPVTTLTELQDFVALHTESCTVFRGQGYPHDDPVRSRLIPSLGRFRFQNSTWQREEKVLLTRFRLAASSHVDIEPGDDAEWLALAQHHGLPTRLLDWTTNYLVAAYFAVERDEGDCDATIFMVPMIPMLKPGENPFQLTTLRRYVPRNVTRRIVAQSGLFTIHHDPYRSIQDEIVGSNEGVCIPIKKAFRRELKVHLYRMGIHRASLFPDLDGLASHLKWMREAYETPRPNDPKVIPAGDFPDYI